VERKRPLDICNIRQVGNLLQQHLVVRWHVNINRTLMRHADLAVRAPSLRESDVLVERVVLLDDTPDGVLEDKGFVVVDLVALPVDHEQSEGAGDSSSKCNAGLPSVDDALFPCIFYGWQYVGFGQGECEGRSGCTFWR